MQLDTLSQSSSFCSDESQQAYIECSLSAKDVKEVGGDDLLTIKSLHATPGDASLSMREGDCYCLMSLTGDLFGKAMIAVTSTWFFYLSL